MKWQLEVSSHVFRLKHLVSINMDPIVASNLVTPGLD